MTTKPAPGSIVFVHSTDIFGRAIRVGETLRWRGGSWCNHCGIVVSDDPDPMVVQATGHGVTRNPLSTIAPGGYYVVGPKPFNVNAAEVAAFAEAQVGAEYGFASIASVIISELSPAFVRVDFRRDGTWICSALAAEALRAGGWVHNWRDVYQVAPAELAEVLAIPKAMLKKPVEAKIPPYI